MSRAQKVFRKPAQKPILPDRKNFDGFPAYSVGVYEQYVQMCMVNTIGNTYYASSEDLFAYSIALHEKMRDTDPGFMARTIIYARNFGLMRMQPIVGLAYLSTIPNKAYFHTAFNKVIKTPGDLVDFVAVIGAIRQGKGLGRTIKKAINAWLTGDGSEARQEGLSQYHAIKYGGGEGNKKWALRDIIKATHPTPKNDVQSALFKYLTQGENSVSLNQIAAIEQLKVLASKRKEMGDTEFTNQVNVLIDEGRLPYETVTGIIKPTAEIWEHLMHQMPIFALVRHLNALEAAGVFNKETNVTWTVSHLTNPEIITRSRMLPFRFSTAYDNFKGNVTVSNALRKSLDLALSNIEMLPGRNAFFLDKSGSMDGEYLKIGSLLGLAALSKSEGAMFLCFGSDLSIPRVDVTESVLTNMERIRSISGGGTDTGLTISHLLGNVSTAKRRSIFYSSEGYDSKFPASQKTSVPVKVDNIFIITDEQQNAGSPVVALFREYRKNVNPNARLFIIDVAPYDAHLANQDEPGVTFVYGWSESVLAIVKYAMEGSGSHVEQIKKMRL